VLIGSYDDYIAVFGRDVQQLIQSQRLFLVGAGAIGTRSAIVG
jgi:hypothetical protein